MKTFRLEGYSVPFSGTWMHLCSIEAKDLVSAAKKLGGKTDNSRGVSASGHNPPRFYPGRRSLLIIAKAIAATKGRRGQNRRQDVKKALYELTERGQYDSFVFRDAPTVR